MPIVSPSVANRFLSLGTTYFLLTLRHLRSLLHDLTSLNAAGKNLVSRATPSETTVAVRASNSLAAMRQSCCVLNSSVVTVADATELVANRKITRAHITPPRGETRFHPAVPSS